MVAVFPVLDKRASPFYTWSVTEGLHRLGFGSDVPADKNTTDPEQVLRLRKKTSEPGFFVTRFIATAF